MGMNDHILHQNLKPAIFAGGYPAGLTTKLDCSRLVKQILFKV